MTTASIPLPFSLYLSNVGRAADDFFGALLSVKPSIVAECLATAFLISRVIGDDDGTCVTASQVRRMREMMGLQPVEP